MSFMITNGVVEYERSNKPADYEKRNAKVVLSYAVAEGSDPRAVMAQVFEMAVAEVHQRIGLNEPAYAAAVSEPSATATEVLARQKTGSYPPTDKAVEVPQANPTPTSTNVFAIGTPTASEAASEAPGSTTTPATTVKDPAPSAATPGPTATKTASPSDPFAITAKAVPQANPTTSPKTASNGSDTSSAVVNSQSASPDPVIDGLTDNDLHAVAQSAIEKKIPAQTIRDITGKYAGQQGMTISQIPADKRPLWLEEVRKLYKS